ncbi:3970_t:CDS:2, partial [Dentiscutata heterogama]
YFSIVHALSECNQDSTFASLKNPPTVEEKSYWQAIENLSYYTLFLSGTT